MTALSTTRETDFPEMSVVTAIRQEEGGSRVTTVAGRQTYELMIPAIGDERAARRWLASARRVHRIEIEVTDSGVFATASGVGHRLPFVRRIPLSIALGLGTQGRRVIVRGGQG